MKTPQEYYPDIFDGIDVYLKREDKHKLASHKGRSIPYMMKKLSEKTGKRHFVISSSGNAALAALLFTLQHNNNNPEEAYYLHIFVGKKISEKKLQALQVEDEYITLQQVERPKQAAFKKDKDGEAILLRQSNNDLALVGYHELGKELEKIENLEAVFIPTSSGTTLQGLAEYFEFGKKKVQMHIAQTAKCAPMAEKFDSAFSKVDSSLAGAIVDNVARRKTKVQKYIEESGGSGWVISDERLERIKKKVEEKIGESLSYNSLLSIAALEKALEKGWKFEGAVVCLITGE